MKTLASVFTAVLSGFALAATPANPGTVPAGLTSSDWSEIRAADDAARHAVQRQEDGDLVARNPGQQWSAEFDGKGFTVTPDHGGWTWGLELTGYADRTLPTAPSQLRHEGSKVTCQRDENLTEWFINDSRGIEQGWDIRQRPERADPAAPLLLDLGIRGNARPQVSGDATSVSFQQESGDRTLSYGGLKAWDADGKTLGVRFEPSSGNGIRIAVDDHGARYPITIDPVAAQQSHLPGSYGAIGVSGDTVVIGSRVYTRNGGAWTQQAALLGSNTEADDYYGITAAISGDTVIIGATREDSAATGVNGDQASNAASNSGAVYVFVRSGTTWTQQAYLKASNTGVDDAFGTSVAISGDTIVVGTNYEDSNATGVNGDGSNNAAASAGAAYVFTRSGTTWSQQAYLKASNTFTDDRFGSAVSVSGDTIVVGAYAEDGSSAGVNGDETSNGKPESGAAYVFTRSGTTWTQQAYLKASNADWQDWFGYTVGVSGDTVVVGAPRENSTATGINGSGWTYYNWAGSAYIFVRNGTTWTQQAYVKASNTDDLDQFGCAVAISGDTVVVGASEEDGSGTGLTANQATNNSFDSGAAYLFKRSGTTWTQQHYIKATNTYAFSRFALNVAVSDGVVLAAGSGGVYITDFFTTGSEIHIKQGNFDIFNGGTASCGPIPPGTSTDVIFNLSNLSVEDLLLTGNPKVAVTGSSDFTVTAQPASPLAGVSSTPFTVRFSPSSEGTKSASLSISSSDSDEGLFVIHLTGTVLSFSSDTDGDGLSDASEYNLAALNFNWQVKQTALVNTYFADVNRTGLYAASQVHVLRPGKKTTITRNPANGRLKLTMDWKKSTGFPNFFNFPAPAGSSVSINPSGGIDFEFASPDNAAFFRIDQE